MAGPTRVRDRRVRVADNLDDTKTPSQIALAIPASITEEDLQVFFLSRLREAIFGTSYTQRWYDDFEGQGIPSLVDTERVQKVVFSYNTPSPLDLGLVQAGQMLDRAVLLITTPFDDPASTLQLGTSTVPGLVLGPNDSDPSVSGQYESVALVEFAVNDTFRLMITPGISTQGSGFLLYKLKS